MNLDISAYLFCFLLVFFVYDVSEIQGYTFHNYTTRIKRDTCLGFRCANGEKCLPGTDRCDGRVDCNDASDEANCGAIPSITNCGSNQFQCDNGQCILYPKLCDGTPDCGDGSDETPKECLNFECRGDNFKCTYGACIYYEDQNNGVFNCVDKSDENETIPTTTTTTTTTVVQGEYCILPPHPSDGQWVTLNANNPQPGQTVPGNTVLEFSCDKGYKLSPDIKLSKCENSRWSETPPSCLKLCSPLYTKEVTKVRCYDNNKIEISCGECIDGYTAHYECAPFYEPSDRVSRTRTCIDGNWNLQTPNCIPVCGEKTVSCRLHSIGGQPVKKGNYPWVAAIFQRINSNFVNVCGGTMITQKLILTAAHCVAEDSGFPIFLGDVKVAVGKYYNQYKDIRETKDVQYSNVDKIIVHKNYRGDIQRFASDIAVLITTDKLVLSTIVQPVCLLDVNNIRLSEGELGEVASWGFTTETGDPSDSLLEISLPYKNEETCKKEFPLDFVNKYLTYDKMCAGHTNKGISLCRGDSGSGLVFRNTRDSRFYVHGIVSLAENEKRQCNSQLSSLLTSVSIHYDWLDNLTSHYP